MQRPAMPRLFPSAADEAMTQKFKTGKYICIAPASVWFTKQFPKEKWIEFSQIDPADTVIYLLGAASDFDLCESIQHKQQTTNGKHNLQAKYLFSNSFADA
jgi:heptosyltransferase-2